MLLNVIWILNVCFFNPSVLGVSSTSSLLLYFYQGTSTTFHIHLTFNSFPSGYIDEPIFYYFREVSLYLVGFWMEGMVLQNELIHAEVSHWSIQTPHYNLILFITTSYLLLYCIVQWSKKTLLPLTRTGWSSCDLFHTEIGATGCV